MSLKSLDLCILKSHNVSHLNQPLQKEIECIPQHKDHEYVYVGNIPWNYKSADLRFYFSQFVEKSAFKCFHYRHRPETQIVRNKDGLEGDGSETNVDIEKKSCCCIIKVCANFTEHFIKRYNGKEWRNKKLEFAKRFVYVKKLKITSNPDPWKRFKSKGEIEAETHVDDQELYFEDLKNLIELNPPTTVMPNGNVGTPMKHFHRLISECKMPSSVIKSLDLQFPKSASKKAYTTVPLDYVDIEFSIKNITEDGSESNGRKHFQKVKSSKEQISGENTRTEAEIRTNIVTGSSIRNNKQIYETEPKIEKKADDFEMKQQNESSYESSESTKDLGEEHDAEDWERHEALHDDVDNQARPKERLFEEDLEVKWEKGGSGLVFYTDAYYWHEIKGKDFDEDTVDDWDVDYSIYYEDGAGDKPARDQLQMRIEQRRRAGKYDGPRMYSQIRRKEKNNREKMMNNFAEFEKHSKGFGSRILKQQGWTEGSGVGFLREGIKEPLDPGGQKSRNRIGLGYYGEKLDRTAKLKRRTERDVYISTVYDDKDGENMNAMRFGGKELLKYRTPAVEFKSEEKKRNE